MGDGEPRTVDSRVGAFDGLTANLRTLGTLTDEEEARTAAELVGMAERVLVAHGADPDAADACTQSLNAAASGDWVGVATWTAASLAGRAKPDPANVVGEAERLLDLVVAAG